MPEIPQDLKKWMGRIEAAKWYRKTYGNTKDRWEKNVKALASDFGTAEKHPSGEAIDVNVTHGTTQLRLAPLYTSDIFITVNPTRKTINIGGRDVDNVARARFTEAEVNYWFNELEVRRRVMRPCARDAESTNHAYAYIGYVRPSDKGLIENPEFKHGRFETNPLIKVGQPFIRRLSPRQVLVPPGAVEFDDHPYIAIEWRRPLEIVKKQYPDTTKDLTPTVDILNIDDVQAGEKSNDFLLDHLRTEDAKLVQIYQIWDQWTGQLYTMAEDHKQWLEDPADWPYRTEGFPVSHMSFVDVPDEYWGTPNMQTYMPQQHELNEARTASKVRNNRLKSVVFMRSDIEEEIGAEYANAPDCRRGHPLGDPDRPWPAGSGRCVRRRAGAAERHPVHHRAGGAAAAGRRPQHRHRDRVGERREVGDHPLDRCWRPRSLVLHRHGPEALDDPAAAPQREARADGPGGDRGGDAARPLHARRARGRVRLEARHRQPAGRLPRAPATAGPRQLQPAAAGS
jgi:hypothetical protein